MSTFVSVPTPSSAARAYSDVLSGGICLVKEFEKADWKFYFFLTQ